jgi:hypothetical protein
VEGFSKGGREKDDAVTADPEMLGAIGD